MSLRSGFGRFFENAKQWGLRTGTQVKQFYHKTRELAHKVKPHLDKGTRFIEGVNVQLQRDLLENPKHKEVAQDWTTRLRKFRDDYEKGLGKADRVHDVLMREYG